MVTPKKVKEKLAGIPKLVYLCIVDKQSTHKYSKNEKIRTSSFTNRNGEEITRGRGCKSAY